MLDLIAKFDGYVGSWLYAGPFSGESLKAEKLLDAEFPPAQRDASDIEWRPLDAGSDDNPWIFDLAKVEACNDCCLYVRTGIWSPAAQPARLELGSDDDVKVWLNGKLVHRNAVGRGLTLGEDQVAVTLQEGWNTLMLKIVNRGGDWGFACTVRDPNGEPMQGLKFEPR